MEDFKSAANFTICECGKTIQEVHPDLGGLCLDCFRQALLQEELD